MRIHLTYANVVSSICLFVVLGGSAYAAAKITGKQIKNNTVTSADIRNGTLRPVDFRRGVLQVPTARDQTPGKDGAPGQDGARGDKGDPGPGAVPLAATLDSTGFQRQDFRVGSLVVGFSCTDRAGRPQVQVWGKTDAGAEGDAYWSGLRDDSAGGQFTTGSSNVVNTQDRGIDSRWSPDGGWASETLDIQYRSGSQTATVSFYMVADDRDSKCRVAGTGVSA